MKQSTPDYLIRGAEFLETHPGFQLVGREAEFAQLSGILLRHSAHSVLLIGPGGVGCTALCLGLQSAKAIGNTSTSFDITSKRLYWLDTDGLFSSGDPRRMNEAFEKTLRTLSRSTESVLIIEDTRDFVESARASGCCNFINALMREIRHEKFRAILEARDDDLEIVLRCHSDMRQLFTIMDLREPTGETLEEIVGSASERLESHHGIQIADEARRSSIELTSKYRVGDMSLSRAQPERALNLIDRALTSYRQEAHAKPPSLVQIEDELKAARHDDDTAKAAVLEKELEVKVGEWTKQQESLRTFQQNQLDAEELLTSLDDELHATIEEDRKKKEAANEEASKKPNADEFSARLDLGGFESEAVSRIRAQIREVEGKLKENKEQFAALRGEVNKDLALTVREVLAEFSRLSGIPVEKLNQDERKKLLELEERLAQRVFGQDHAIQKLAGAVRVASAGLKDPEKPQASFMFLGPSGVGKTELAKALASVLKDDERALLRFDMSEYMEKHASAKLIGAPPGYEGYEAGGTLTNAMRRNPHVVVLFDEIEKAHPDVFNIFLQVLDDGRLTDNRGLTVSFSEAIVLMTTNIGQRNFLNTELTYDEAVGETLKELDEVYRPEFLNRFNGRENIVCFNRLELPVIERIAKREINKLNNRIHLQNPNLHVNMDADTLSRLCADKYIPVNGARGIAGYFNSNIYPAIAETVIRLPEAKGEMTIQYDSDTQSVNITASEGISE